MKKLFALFLVACSPSQQASRPLILSEQEPPGDNCPAGGVKILTGVDTNQDAALSEDELSSAPAYVCSGETLIKGETGLSVPAATGPTGPSGSDGANGSNGTNGENGTTGATGPTGAVGIAEGLVPTPAGTTAFRTNYVFYGQTATGLQMDFLDTTNFAVQPGAFNGAGTGNKAFVGFNEFSGRPFNTLTTIDVTFMQSVGPNNNIYMNYIIDTNGDGVFTPPTGTPDSSGDCIVVSLWPNATNGEPGDTFTLDMASASFGAVGPGSSTVCGLPKHTSPTGLLSSLTGYSNGSALLLNAATGDGGMPNGRIMPAITFVVGDSNNRVLRKIDLRELKLTWSDASEDLFEF
jgi:hypothetical protein